MDRDRLWKRVAVVIRASGERTQETCEDMLRRWCGADAVARVEATPFSAALRASLESGHATGRPWTLCIDADVIPAMSGLFDLVRAGEEAPRHAFEVQGLVHDKLFNVTRAAGNHLYRTALIPMALALIPAEGDSLRPEHDMLNAMGSRGHRWGNRPIVVGLHDFEQSFEDIFRKAFLHAHKHRDFLDALVGAWRSLRDRDPDFAVALEGLDAGLRYEARPAVAKGFGTEGCEQRLEALGLHEKPPMAGDPPDQEALRNALLALLSPPERVAREIFEKRVHAGLFPSANAGAFVRHRRTAADWVRRHVPRMSRAAR